MARDLKALVERARRGDRGAFEQLVRVHHRRVYMTAYRMTGNRDDADDVTQEAFVRAYRGLASFGGKSDFFTWVYRIAVNVTLNFLRSARRRRTVSIDDVILPERLQSEASGDPRRALEFRRMLVDLAEALDSLSPSLRATVVLVLLEGMSYRDAAEILECSVGTVAWRIHEARHRLRGRLAKYLTEAAVPADASDATPSPDRRVD